MAPLKQPAPLPRFPINPFARDRPPRDPWKFPERLVSYIDVFLANVIQPTDMWDEYMAERCWMWTGKVTPSGVPFLNIFGCKVSAHTFAYEYYVADPPEGMVIRPYCPRKLCVSPKHLLPRARTGGNRKLDPEAARRLRRDYETTHFERPQLAEIYGVSLRRVHQLTAGLAKDPDVWAY